MDGSIAPRYVWRFPFRIKQCCGGSDGIDLFPTRNGFNPQDLRSRTLLSLTLPCPRPSGGRRIHDDDASTYRVGSMPRLVFASFPVLQKRGAFVSLSSRTYLPMPPFPPLHPGPERERRAVADRVQSSNRFPSVLGSIDGVVVRFGAEEKMASRADRRLMDQVFNLKLTAKQLERQSKKCEKEEKAERGRVKKAIEKGNMEGAQIYAQNAIRKKNEQLNYLRLASRLDAVVSRLDTQAKMNLVNKNMVGIVKSLDSALKSNNLEQISATMDSFEKQFESLDLRTEYLEKAMSNATAITTPAEQVQELMQQVADEHSLELQTDMPRTATAVPAAEAQNDLARRLEELKAKN